MRIRTAVLVLLLPALAIAAPRKRPVRPARPVPPAEAQLLHTGDLAEKDLGPGVRQKALVEQLQAKAGPVALRLVRLNRESIYQPPRGRQVVAAVVLDGALRLEAPAAKAGRKKLPELKERLEPNDGLYARSPAREGWKLVGDSEESRLLVLVVPAPPPKRRAEPATPAIARASQAQVYEIANGHGEARMLFDPARTHDGAAYVGRLRASTGLSIPEHVHAGEAELLYVQTGFGEMTINGKVQPVIPGDVVYVPPNTPHAFRVTSSDAVSAVQLYTPGGPEQRFKKSATAGR